MQLLEEMIALLKDIAKFVDFLRSIQQKARDEEEKKNLRSHQRIAS